MTATHFETKGIDVVDIHPQALPLNQVSILAGFWHDRMAVNREQTLPAIYDKLKSTGRLDAWRRDVPDDQLHRHIFWDSDTAKWIEAAGYALVGHRDEALERQVDEVVNWMAEAQEADGYLNSYFALAHPEGRWKNLRDNHELYCAGHLLEAGIAYQQSTGKTTLLDVMRRYADLIARTFGRGAGQLRGYCGHPEIELALVRLAETSNATRYLELARYFVEERGQTPNYYDLEAEARGENPRDFWARTYRYCQAHQPVRQQTIATGHSVRAAYLYSAMTDLARRYNDVALAETCRTLWDDLTTRQMYIIGGMGPSETHEGFTYAYDLPNETAYGETCSAIALGYFAQRLFELDGKGAYIDVLERAFYNNVLGGVSAEGRHFFQCNPLIAYPYYSPYVRWNGILADRHYRRVDWIDCACCPTNLVRLVASVNGYVYATTADTVYVNLFASSRARLQLNGAAVTLEQYTHYPWEGAVHIEVRASEPTTFTLAVRIPGWCRNHTLTVNGAAVDTPVRDGYARLERRWTPGDVIDLDLAMPIERMVAHPEIRQDAGQVALQRGPIVYCAEEVDNGARLANLVLPATASLTAERDPGLFGGLGVITGEALRVEPAAWPGGIYQPEGAAMLTSRPQPFKAIPYAFWANRAPGEMRVWLRAA